MNDFQVSGDSATVDKTRFQFGMQPDQVTERITGLFGPSNEVRIIRKAVMHCTRLWRKDHSRSGHLEAVSQFDILHAVDAEVLVKSTHTQKHLRGSRYVARVVIGKIDRSF